MRVSYKGVNLIKQFEGCRLEAYRDPVGIWTIGYGHTEGVKQSHKITQHQAEILLEVDLEEFEDYVNEYVTSSLNQNQFDALVSWVYNLGPGNMRNSTMLKVLNEGKYDEVPYQIKRWNKAGGQVLRGLVRRRDAEAELFEGKE